MRGDTLSREVERQSRLRVGQLSKKQLMPNDNPSMVLNDIHNGALPLDQIPAQTTRYLAATPAAPKVGRELSLESPQRLPRIRQVLAEPVKEIPFLRPMVCCPPPCAVVDRGLSLIYCFRPWSPTCVPTPPTSIGDDIASTSRKRSWSEIEEAECSSVGFL